MPILGVDTGGTFTDFYLIADDGSVAVYKRPSTPDDPARAILDGLAEIAGGEDGGWKTGDGLDLVHGSTVATNAIIERKGARTALITTRGFRDVLEIGRQTRPRLYDLSPRREAPLVPEELRFEADERNGRCMGSQSGLWRRGRIMRTWAGFRRGRCRWQRN